MTAEGWIVAVLTVALAAVALVEFVFTAVAWCRILRWLRSPAFRRWWRTPPPPADEEWRRFRRAV